jgi:dynactin complex subunit
LKEREERIIEFQGKEKAFRHLEECYAKLRKEKDETLVKLNERVKENKQLALQLDEALRRVATLEEEIGEIEEENSRTKERGEKIDLLMKENNRLNSVLMDKVNDIEKLQFRINHLESKFTNANSEAVKQKAVAEQR